MERTFAHLCLAGAITVAIHYVITGGDLRLPSPLALPFVLALY